MVVMSDDYNGLLRTIYGEPTVDGDLWDTVTSVGEGDGDAYAAALVAIGREYGCYCVEAAVRDQRAPGVVLDALIDRFSADDRLPLLIAGHPNVTENVERFCRQKRDMELNECLAKSPGVSDETAKRLLKSKSMRVVEALLGNAALSEDVLRRAERRARVIGMSMMDIVCKGGSNASMPSDVVGSWLASSDERVRINALASPVAPPDALWEHLTRKTVFDSYSYPDIDIFPPWSNADSDMIDWFLSRWEKQKGSELLSGSQRIECLWTAEAALTHPRARAGTLERMYSRYGSVNTRVCLAAAKAPSSPDWVRRDAIRRAVDAGYSASVRVNGLSASPECARLLYEYGCLAAAADCGNAPGDLLVEILGAKLRAAAEEKSVDSDYASFLAHGALADMLPLRNMPPDVRHMCARWFSGVLWLVARDVFLGRA